MTASVDMPIKLRLARFGHHLSLCGNSALLLVLLLVTLPLCGCGDSRGIVHGRVTLDGQPLAGGSDVNAIVQFNPIGGSGTLATGSLDGQGRYSLASGSQKSVMPGNYVVTVSAIKLIRSGTPGDLPSGRPITPRRYADPKQSEWEVEVKPGENTFDFELTSDG